MTERKDRRIPIEPAVVPTPEEHTPELTTQARYLLAILDQYRPSAITPNPISPEDIISSYNALTEKLGLEDSISTSDLPTVDKLTGIVTKEVKRILFAAQSVHPERELTAEELLAAAQITSLVTPHKPIESVISDIQIPLYKGFRNPGVTSVQSATKSATRHNPWRRK